MRFDQWLGILGKQQNLKRRIYRERRNHPADRINHPRPFGRGALFFVGLTLQLNRFLNGVADHATGSPDEKEDVLPLQFETGQVLATLDIGNRHRIGHFGFR